MITNTDENLIKNILKKGTEDVFVEENLEKRLKSGKQLKVKLGIDPTSPDIHLGNAVQLWKIRKFQDLGHKAVIIIGDFTAQIGDPSDKLNKRPMLSREEIQKNMAGYKKLLSKIIDIKNVEFLYNSKWLSKISSEEIIQLAEAFTVNQMAARRNFKERIKKGGEVSLREFLYPLLQGYDSYHIQADVEVGGFDQLFNLKAGRTVQKHMGQQEQDVLTTKMLDGTDGRKMSKSWGNVVSITDEPKDMFGKIMSINDDLISQYFLLCTDFTEEEIKKDEADVENPRDRKLKLAENIISKYHNKEEAKKAKDCFIKTFSERGVPDKIQEIKTKAGEVLADTVIKEGLVTSKSEWGRLVEAGAVKIYENNGSQSKIENRNYKIEKSQTIQIGKKTFVRFVAK